MSREAHSTRELRGLRLFAELRVAGEASEGGGTLPRMK